MSSGTDTWVAKIEAPPSWWAGAPSFWPVSVLWDREEISAQDFRTRFEQARQQQRQEQGDAFDARAFETPENKRRILDELIDQRVQQHGRDARRRGRQRCAGAATRSWRCRRSRSTASSTRRVTSSRWRRSADRSPRTFEQDVRESLQQSLLPTRPERFRFVTRAEMDRLLKLLAEERAMSLRAWCRRRRPTPAPVSAARKSSAVLPRTPQPLPRTGICDASNTWKSTRSRSPRRRPTKPRCASVTRQEKNRFVDAGAAPRLAHPRRRGEGRRCGRAEGRRSQGREARRRGEGAGRRLRRAGAGE